MSKQKILRGNQNIVKTVDEKKEIVEKATEKFGEFLDTLGFDWKNDPHMKDTPRRVSKSFVNDLISGCYNEAPIITAFDNHEKYSGLVYSGLIPINSLCSHHFLSFIGECHICYLPDPDGKVIGYSKLGRIADWLSRRPNVQENLVCSIHDYVNKICEGNKGVGVVIFCKHLCACARGAKMNSLMGTSKLSGALLDNNDQSRFEFYKFIEMSKKVS